jgi:hypothetical protein
VNIIMAPLARLFRQLGFLRLGFRGARVEEDDGRVLHLFHNRAQLKKSYIALQDELQRSKDRIKQQEGATARVQEMLQGLEARLAVPDTGYPALVFYQLRELWSLGRSLLTQFVAELAAQQEERERRQFLAEYNRARFDRRQEIEGQLNEVERRAAEVRGRVTALEQELARLRHFWHYFRRRRLKLQLQAANLQNLLSAQELEAARKVRDDFEAEPMPEFAGLSLEARRAINVAAVAYAQVLCDRLEKTSLVALARAAAARREPPREDYGDRARCEALMREIQRARQVLQQRSNLSQEIKLLCERLREQAKYRNAIDTVPTPDSVTGAPATTQVLAEDLWEIYRVLLR